MAASPSGRGRPSKQAKAAASDMTSHLLGASELCGLIGYEEAVAATLPVSRKLCVQEDGYTRSMRIVLW